MARVAQREEGVVSSDLLVVDSLVVEVLRRGPDVVLLTHLEVLAEVLVSAPEVEVHHASALVPEGLVEVGVAQVVLVPVVRHSLGVDVRVVVVGLGSNVAPAFKARILLGLAVLGNQVVLVEHVEQVNVQDSDAVVARKDVCLPIDVAWKVFDGSHGVLEPSPLLGFVAGLLGLRHEFTEVTISLTDQRSLNRSVRIDLLT